MRDIATKVNGTTTLDAGDFNALNDELENIVNSADLTLDPAGGPDTDLNMLGQTAAAYANAGNVYTDSGAANAYVLSISTNLKAVAKYFDNMLIVFKVGNANTGASTVNVESLGVKDLETPTGVALSSGALQTSGFVTARYNLSDDRFEIVDASPPVPQNVTVQTVELEDGAVATGTTVLPLDDTVPQNGEGDQYMSLAITPTLATNKLKIEVVFFGAHSTDTGPIVVALFQDATASAIAAGIAPRSSDANANSTVAFSHTFIAGTTSSTTFKIRAGNQNAGTTTFNGQSGARLLGGVLVSSIKITEIKQ